MWKSFALGAGVAAGVLCLSSCDKSDEARLLEKIERAKLSEMYLRAEKQEEAVVLSRLEDQLVAGLAEGQRLVLFCASDLRDPIQSAQLDILTGSIPAIGHGLVLRHVDAKGDAGLQLSQLQAIQKAKPAVLLVYPVEPRLSTAVLQDIQLGGSIVFGLDAMVGDDAANKVAFVDPKKLGQQAGEVALAALKRKAGEGGKIAGRVVQLTADEDAVFSRQASAGLSEALKQAPDVVLVHDAPGLWSREGGAARIAEALRLQGEFDVVVAQTDAIARGASEALSAAGRRESVLVVSLGGVRGPDGGVDLLRRAVIDAVVRCPLPMEKVYDDLKKLAIDPGYKPSPGREELVPDYLTPKNVDDAVRGY